MKYCIDCKFIKFTESDCMCSQTQKMRGALWEACEHFKRKTARRITPAQEEHCIRLKRVKITEADCVAKGCKYVEKTKHSGGDSWLCSWRRTIGGNGIRFDRLKKCPLR